MQEKYKIITLLILVLSISGFSKTYTYPYKSDLSWNTKFSFYAFNHLDLTSTESCYFSADKTTRCNVANVANGSKVKGKLQTRFVDSRINEGWFLGHTIYANNSRAQNFHASQHTDIYSPSGISIAITKDYRKDGEYLVPKSFTPAPVITSSITLESIPSTSKKDYEGRSVFYLTPKNNKYKKLEINSTLDLQSGEYYIDTLKVSSSHIQADNSNKPIVIHVKHLEWMDNKYVSTTAQQKLAKRFLIIDHAQKNDIIVKEPSQETNYKDESSYIQGNFAGTILAPNSYVYTKSNGTGDFYGSIIAKRICIENYLSKSKIFFVPYNPD